MDEEEIIRLQLLGSGPEGDIRVMERDVQPIAHHVTKRKQIGHLVCQEKELRVYDERQFSEWNLNEGRPDCHLTSTDPVYCQSLSRTF